MTFTILLPFALTFFITAIITYFSIPIIRRLGLVDDPKLHKHPGIIHTKIIPRSGGIPLFLGIFLVSIFFIPVSKVTIGIFLASLLSLIIGVLDDYYNAKSRDISPYLRFGVNILCAAIVVGSGVTIPFITHPLGGILHLTIPILPFHITLGDIIAGIWIIWVMNMLNWSKGIDGQMPGIVAISAIVIGILSLRFPFVDNYVFIDANLSFIIAGAALGFLVFNFSPAKIFPGYGATSMYLLLAVVSILSSAKFATAILVMGIPIIDAIFTIVRRILSGKSPFLHDNKHLHHILLRFGYSQRQIALFYWCFSAIVGTIALTLKSESKPFALLVLLAIVGGALLFLHFSVRYSHEKDSS
ncbi:MAG: undecaprenyl/decaprenyl-phosphate alpha-N-acetylglucosaminyl 1-phosphate transferase [Candidatus Levybacteria bacterium]|nr:undecaprenyl/decaprenyl-phosphate alpha-N-acetylglucosaminyl 1-phosphate transferase [Candidatus Levybacteria bacterium]